ncbi:MAG: NAD(P)-dependent dehydrogenase (short-subunit alcohol dehydrogenase family) [Gammaproteobacteria bacterium]|jgi:NAD(P)-dependent dehydrogenase (short-subunit alcohol dehydrogenase family)
MEIKGKKALVFGGTSGIGLAATCQLAQRGAKVIAISRNPDRARDALPAGVEVRACDVLDRDALAILFAECAPYDILISAATGGERARGAFLEMDLDGFQGSFAKVWGYTNCVHLGTEHLAADGCIVLVSGTPAKRAKQGQIALGAVGAAIESFVRTVAVELAPKRINVVSPGVIDTPMFGPESADRTAAIANITKGHAIPRGGQADEIAMAITFVVENDFVTGTVVEVDGGALLA